MNGSFDSRMQEVSRRVEAACARSGRLPKDVHLLAVSKNVPPDMIIEASEHGLTVFGESRVQEAKQKIPLCPGHLAWHMVGHLQTNKAKYAAQLFGMIHSVDSEKLLVAIDKASEAVGITMPVCVEVNVSGESSKFGLPPETVPALLKTSETLMHVEIVGLMTIPPAARDPEDARPFFSKLRNLRDCWRDSTGFVLPELSMGMSHDFEIAIEEGATWVRLGTILFGQRTLQ